MVLEKYGARLKGLDEVPRHRNQVNRYRKVEPTN